MPKEYRPLDNEETFYREAFGREFKDLSTVVMKFPYYKHLLAQKAVSGILDGWKVIKTANFGFTGNLRPIRYIQFDVDYNVKEEAVRNGVLLYENISGDRIAVQFDVSNRGTEENCRTEVSLTSHKERKDELESLAIKIEEWMKENNYFRRVYERSGASHKRVVGF